MTGSQVGGGQFASLSFCLLNDSVQKVSDRRIAKKPIYLQIKLSEVRTVGTQPPPEDQCQHRQASVTNTDNTEQNALKEVLKRSRELSLLVYEKPLFSKSDYLECLNGYKKSPHLNAIQEEVFRGTTPFDAKCSPLSLVDKPPAVHISSWGYDQNLPSEHSYWIHINFWEQAFIWLSTHLASSGHLCIEDCRQIAQTTSCNTGLYQWRDEVARERDESLEFVLPKQHLLNLAMSLPGNAKEMKAVLGWTFSLPLTSFLSCIRCLRLTHWAFSHNYEGQPFPVWFESYSSSSNLLRLTS